MSRALDVGPGFVRARECPDCGHTRSRCGEDCVCNCDAARAEHEAADLREVNAQLLAALKVCWHSMDRRDEPGSPAFDGAMAQAAAAIAKAEGRS